MDQIHNISNYTFINKVIYMKMNVVHELLRLIYKLLSFNHKNHQHNRKRFIIIYLE